MKKPQELPKSVNNLRAIWDSKKVEMQFTQVEAAKELGWSQGAISHYLNNITSLGPSAIIKFANFLGVDPLDIDPEIREFLPNTRTRVIRYSADNLSKKIDEKIYDRHPKSAFWIRTSRKTFKYASEAVAAIMKLKKVPDHFSASNVYHTCICPTADYPDARSFLVQLKGEKEAYVYRPDDLPPAEKILKKFAVLHTEIS